MNTVGFHLLRILPDNVIMDVRRSPDVKLETSCYETLRNMVNQPVKERNNATATSHLEALNEIDKEGHSGGGDGVKSDSVQESG